MGWFYPPGRTKSASTNLLIPSPDPFSAEPVWENTTFLIFLAAPVSLADDEQQGRKVLSCPSTLLQEPAPLQWLPL